MSNLKSNNMLAFIIAIFTRTAVVVQLYVLELFFFIIHTSSGFDRIASLKPLSQLLNKE